MSCPANLQLLLNPDGSMLDLVTVIVGQSHLMVMVSAETKDQVAERFARYVLPGDGVQVGQGTGGALWCLQARTGLGVRVHVHVAGLALQAGGQSSVHVAAVHGVVQRAVQAAAPAEAGTRCVHAPPAQVAMQHRSSIPYVNFHVSAQRATEVETSAAFILLSGLPNSCDFYFFWGDAVDRWPCCA